MLRDPPPQTSRARFPSGFWAFGRHQLSAFVSTCADFSMMTLAHELCGFHPVEATVFGATLGAVVNFQLGRHWVFGARQGTVWRQAMRYAAVSLGCVILNAAGMARLVSWLGASDYLAYRVAVSLAVSVFWSFPAQRWFVFNVKTPAESSDAELLEEEADAALDSVRVDDIRLNRR
jgi:putative flippase GtrA